MKVEGCIKQFFRVGARCEDKRDAAFVITLNACHSEYWQDVERRAIYGKSDPVVGQDGFCQYLFRVTGVIVCGNATLGNDRKCSTQLYESPDRNALGCLRFLQRQRNLERLIGLA